MRWMFAAALAALSAAAATQAADESPVRSFVAQGEGTLTIEPDGTVSAATLPEGLDPALRDAYAAAIRRWTFQPIVVDGRPVRALGHMQLSFAVQLKGEALHAASIERVTFTDPPADDASTVDPALSMRAPSYPMGLARDGVGGEVILAVETDADGRVTRVAPQAGTLYVGVRAGQEARARRAFDLLARASVQAASHWRLPGCRASVCTVPVRYTIQNSADRPSFWQPAHPVAVTPEPWMGGTGSVALGAGGALPSSRILPTGPVEGRDVLNAGG